jgi:MoaA/NifB/PqqE/SkfB family radical SAM enzyme
MSAESISIEPPATVVGIADEIRSLPILILNVHENCNCRCTMCDIWKRPPGKELELDRVRKYQADLKKLNVQQVVLTGGEPLLHSHFEDLCNLFRECSTQITLLSTGLLLKKRAQVVADYVDEVIISLDGPEETHNRIRNVSQAFRLIHEGITAVRHLRPEIAIHARSTIQHGNFTQLRKTVAAAKFLGCTSISFLAVDTASQAFNRELIWPEESLQRIGLTSAQISTLEEEIELLIAHNAADFQNGYIVESPGKLRRIARYFRSRLGELPSIAPPCNAPWVSAVLEVDGSLRPCFFHRIVAETREQSLIEALNSSAAIQFRQTLNVAEDRTCQNCVCSLKYRVRET